MKIKFNCDSGANIHSCRSEVIDTADLGLAEGEWEKLSEEERRKTIEEWAWDCLEMWWEKQ